ncbi:AFR089Wp [Eremothecium gossypii ATCC 10895]|uniref:AFR089Wp n=1 Tax=Eremothecium gossypii (strain ATCC 10895 / CBS 109.51 / FGSC 9923 / NRRL Y-1056) TaxID=284811 RepID=Q754I5_EREGS|nr:AFR089Wp [Eremothecium gossypii ATCC 10895]AAS53460.2 AFR089Wp [Eremothecium gossypii ATCC 10895]AEY97772.1 FAFR089Wp [Eremothecium gossypii FDAG1]
MSGSFWKFSQEYSTESSLTKLLNRAFIRVEERSRAETEQENEAKRSKEEKRFDVIESEHEEEEEGEEGEQRGSRAQRPLEGGELPETESEYKNYRPNLEVLNELLDDEELYTELMCSNFKLMIFFKYPAVLDVLVDYVTNERILEETLDLSEEEDNDDEHVDLEPLLESTEDKEAEQLHGGEVAELGHDESDSSNTGTQPQETDEQVQSRRARMAAEILSADVWPISSAFIEHDELLYKLWSILDHPAPLSIVASTYFMKINERLLDMDIASMIRFILNQDNLVDRYLTHIDNPPLMDFLLKVISTDKPDTPTHVIGLLKYQKLISKLLDHLSPEWSSSVQSAAGDFLKALITISANSNNEIASAIGPNELTRELVSPAMASKLGDIMLNGGTSLSNGVGIVIELIRKNNSDYDFFQVMYTTLKTHPPNDRDPVYLGHLVKSFANKLPEFNAMLLDTKLPPLETPFGTIEPLGFERFKICELIAELLHCSNMGLLNEPKGEEIVNERDIDRECVLRLEGYGIPKNCHDEERSVSVSPIEEEDLAKKIRDLQLVTDKRPSSDNSVESLNSDSQQATTPIHQLGTEIHSEDSSDAELSEQALREKPVVGDQLKIALQDNKIITTILGMFFKYPWNNFLHNVVFDIVQQIFNGPLKTGYNRFLLADLFASAHITEAIIEGDRKCHEYERETGLRLGYMGHLTLVAEEVAKFASYIDEMKISFSNPVISESLNDQRWREYTELVLAETRGKYSTVLGDLAEEEGRNVGKGANEEDNARYYNSDEIYHGSYAEHDDENYAEYSDVDGNRYYEYEDGSGHTTRIHLNQLDNDNIDDIEEASNADTDNKFRNYMSHQLANDYNTTSFSPDNEDEGQWASVSGSNRPGEASSNYQSEIQIESSAMSKQSIFHHQQFDLQDHEDGDDYMDPNDDGQSYAKPNHPLYSNMLPSQPENVYRKTSEVAEEGDSDESDEEMIVVEGTPGFDESTELDQSGTEYALCRTSSKDEKMWTSPEQHSTRIIGMNNNMFNRSKDLHKDE